jgi:DNA-binding XRE family transcriptional regulator
MPTTTPRRPARALRTPDQLRAFRAEHGLSRIALARLLDVRDFTVWRWENGQVNVPKTVELALNYLDQTLPVSG